MLVLPQSFNNQDVRLIYIYLAIHFISDYEVLEVSSDDDGSKPIIDGDEDATSAIPSLRRKFKTEIDNAESLPVTPYLTPPVLGTVDIASTFVSSLNYDTDILLYQA